ncbi:MAG: family 20 glycosylhydrolase [Betaproteobacteria bacterium]|nr:family 20 glycosylhydrolase [Betaproteobacteria bacterium]
MIKSVIRQNKKRVYIFAFALMSACVAMPVHAAEVPSIIPNPAVLSVQQGEFRIAGDTAIIVPAGDREARRAADYLRDLVQRTRGLNLKVQNGAARDGAINFVRERKTLSSGGAYRLHADTKRVTISGGTASGLLYGGISLWQLLGVDSLAVPAVKIDDAPRFAWRGIMLDSARHFQSPEFIRQYIDWMALHKLNVLHWHLTDDQSWRLEIRRYPELTKIAGYRVPAGPAAQADIDPATGKPRLYGGFYSQKTVREIVAYAAERGITVVPEIEMPGHATATLVAFPKLGSTDHPPKVVPADWGVYEYAYNADEATFTFLENVLKEVMALFPSKYIHVGGDEVSKTQWKESPQVQARMKQLGIKEPAALQVYFTQRMARFLKKNGRKLVGWDEILEPGLPDGSVVMSWRGLEGAFNAASKGFDTILSPWPTLYFDNRQSAAADQPPGRGRVISIEDVYKFEPMPDKLNAAERKHVLGLQGNVWTEHIRFEDRVGYMTFPRAAAIAELGWSAPERRDWAGFVKRLSTQFGRYDQLKIPYADSAFAVEAKPVYGAGQAAVALTSQTGFGDIRYTLDGSTPTATSPRYQSPVMVPIPGELRAATFSGERRTSTPRAIPLRRELAQRRASQQLKLCSANIDLSLEDDAPVAGPRAVFLMDINNPCWIFEQADMDKVKSIAAAVGQVPFNFQIGEEVKKIRFAAPATPEGELNVHLGKCDGEIIARLPLKPAVSSNGVTVLPPATIAGISGKHDLCLKFAQRFNDPAVDPVWALDWVDLVDDNARP